MSKETELTTIVRGMETILSAMDHRPADVNHAKALRAVVKSCGQMARIMAERMGPPVPSSYAGVFDFLKGIKK